MHDPELVSGLNMVPSQVVWKMFHRPAPAGSFFGAPRRMVPQSDSRTSTLSAYRL